MYFETFSPFPEENFGIKGESLGEILNSRAFLSEYRALWFSTEDVAFLQQGRVARSLAQRSIGRSLLYSCLAWRCPSRCGVSGYSASRTGCDRVLRAHRCQMEMPRQSLSWDVNVSIIYKF